MKHIRFVFAVAFALLLGGYAPQRSWAQCPANPVLDVTAGNQDTWTVPSGGFYKIKITAKGARGGNSMTYTGGKGATMIGEFIVSSGQVLEAIAGTAGGDQSTINGGVGGGAGSGVRIGSTILIIAGGGGGASASLANAGNGGDGGTGTSGGNGVDATGGTGGSSGSGGGLGFTTSASGGGGALSNGAGDYGGGAGFGGIGGGGSPCSNCSMGGSGFGGGGGAVPTTGAGGGGGGGYSGGGGGGRSGGGGGGSINTGDNQVNTAGDNNGGGQVVIECLGTVPTLNVDEVSQNEGDAGTTSFTFTVSLSEPAGAGGVTFDIATADGTAQDDNPATEDNDYVQKSLTSQTIAEGNSTYMFSVTVNGDLAVESDETFFVNVTNVTGAGVSDGQGEGTIINDDVPPPTIKPFVFLANKITLEETKQKTPGGDMHSNGTLTVTKGDPSTYNSNLTAVGKITIEKYNTINGDVTSQTSISNSGKINGTKTIGAVASESLPSLSYSAGGPNKSVPSGGSLTLAPGSYGNVTMSNHGKLKLTSGEYFINQLRYSDSIEGGVIEIDLSSGNPVTINVVNDLQLGHEAAIVLKPNGEADSKLVTFNTLQTTNAYWGREAYLVGSFNAPNALVTLVKNTQLRGAICAKEIIVNNDCLFLHHDSPGSLPGPGNLPKTFAEEADSYQLIAESYELSQNYPNPFNPITTISFALPQAGEVTLGIYNTNGALVKRLVAGEMNAGRHSFTWDATDQRGERVASGVYLYVIKAGEFTAQRKLVLMK